MWVFMQKRVGSRVLIFLTCLWFFYIRTFIILLVFNATYFNTNKLNPYIAIVCVSLFHDYEGIFSNEIPSGLLPIREIKHQIDLVSVVAIPK